MSDAAESFVNLIGAMMALAMLTIAARPADEDHSYGHGKAEHLAALAEAGILVLASLFLAFRAVMQLSGSEPSHVRVEPEAQ